MTLFELQVAVKSWADHNFPDAKPHMPLLGLVEEVGELSHSHLKREQGIRGSSESHFAAAVDAVGDILIFLADYCNRNEIDMGRALEITWEKVSQRDWQADPVKGGE